MNSGSWSVSLMQYGCSIPVDKTKIIWLSTLKAVHRKAFGDNLDVLYFLLMSEHFYAYRNKLVHFIIITISNTVMLLAKNTFCIQFQYQLVDLLNNILTRNIYFSVILLCSLHLFCSMISETKRDDAYTKAQVKMILTIFLMNFNLYIIIIYNRRLRDFMNDFHEF